MVLLLYSQLEFSIVRLGTMHNLWASLVSNELLQLKGFLSKFDNDSRDKRLVFKDNQISTSLISPDLKHILLEIRIKKLSFRNRLLKLS